MASDNFNISNQLNYLKLFRFYQLLVFGSITIDESIDIRFAIQEDINRHVNFVITHIKYK